MTASDPFAKVKSAATALDGIRSGGGHVLILAHQRLNEVRDHLTAGRFDRAMESANALREKVGQLAQAQVSMGLLADNALIKVSELKEGMIVPGAGPVTEIGPCPGCGQEGCGKVSFTVAEQVLVLDGELEIVVEA